MQELLPFFRWIADLIIRKKSEPVSSRFDAPVTEGEEAEFSGCFSGAQGFFDAREAYLAGLAYQNRINFYLLPRYAVRCVAVVFTESTGLFYPVFIHLYPVQSRS